MASFKKNIFFLLILQGSNYLIPLMTLPYLSRVLGVEGFGTYGLVLAVAQYFILFIDFGYNMTATKKIAENKHDKKYVSTVFWQTIFSKIILLLISFFILLIMVLFPFLGGSKFEMLYISIMMIGSIMMPIWLFQGLEDLTKVTVFSVLGKLFVFPLLFLLVKSENDISLAVFLYSLTYFVSGIIAIYITYKYKFVFWVRPTVKSMFLSLKESSGFFLAAFIISLYTVSTPIILSLVSDIEQVSLFSAGDRVRSAILGVFYILGGAIYPRVNAIFKEDIRKAYLFIRSVLLIKLVFGLFFGVVLFIGSKRISVLIYGAEFYGVADVLMILSFSLIFSLLSVVFSNYILLPLGHKKEYIALPFFSASIHLLLCSFLGFYYGAIGGAYSILIVEMFTLLALIFITNRKVKLAKVVSH